MASHGIKDRVAIVGHGLHPVRRALGQGPRRPDRRGRRGHLRLGRRDQGRRRRLLVRHRPVGHERHHPGPAAAAGGQAGHPGGELLHHRLRGAAGRRLRRGLRRLRRGHGGGGGKGQGLRLPGAQRLPHPQRRHGTDPDRGGHVLDGGPGLREEVRRGRGRADRGAGPDLVEEPPATAPATPGPSSARRSRPRPSAPHPGWPGGSGSSTAPAWPTGPPRAIVVRAEDAHRYTDKPIYIKALSFAAGSGSGLIDPEYDYTWFPECARAAEDAYRQAGITDPRAPAGHGRGARLLHADRAGADGGPRLRRAGHGVEGGAGRHLRPQRRAAGQPRRRAQELRPPGRRLGAADVLRGLAAAAGRGHPGAPDRTPTGSWPSPTTWAATPARWCRSCRWSVPSWADGHPSQVRPGPLVEQRNASASASDGHHASAARRAARATGRIGDPAGPAPRRPTAPWSASMVACTSQNSVPSASMPYQRRRPSPLVAAMAAAWVS